MKREEMTKVMRMKIIESALQEFNDKSYEKVLFIIILKIKMNCI